MRRLLPSIEGLTVAALAFLVTFTVRVKVDDAWWHLGAGEYMLATRTLPTTNHFSFTAPGTPWLAHEWLAEVLFALLYRLGPSVLSLFAMLLQVLAFALIARLAGRHGRTPGFAAVLTFAASLLLIANFSIRPYLFGNLALLATLWLVEHPGTARPARIVTLFALWANLHGSFIFGLGVLGLGALADVALRRRHLIELGLATVACLATPHHVKGLLFPLLYLRTSLSSDETFLSNIMEWQRVTPGSALGVMLMVYLAAAIAIIVASRTKPRAMHVGLLVVFSLAGFSAVRNVALVGIALAVVLPRHLDALARTPSPLAELKSSAVLPLTAWVLAALTTLGKPLPHDFFPRDAISQLDRHSRVFNSFNWGGALIFAGVSPFIDQRNDCYPPEVLRDYFTVHRLEPGWEDVLRRWQIDTVLWPVNGALATELAHAAAWQATWHDEQAIIFRRAP